MNRLVVDAPSRYRIPLVPPSYDDESLASWIERIGVFYGLDFETWLASVMIWTGTIPSTATHDVDGDKSLRALLVQLTGLPECEAPQTLPAGTPDSLPQWARVAFCPECWDSDVMCGRQPFVRRRWCSWRQIVCVEHGRYLAARRRIAIAGIPLSQAWAPLWRSRKSWATSLALPYERGASRSLWNAPGHYSCFSPGQIGMLASELGLPCSTVAPAGASVPRDPASDRRERALELVMSDGFARVTENVRAVVLGLRGERMTTPYKKDGILYTGRPLRPRLLENRIGVLVTVAELLRMMAARPAIADAVADVMRIAVRAWRPFESAGTRSALAAWPATEREHLADRLGFLVTYKAG